MTSVIHQKICSIMSAWGIKSTTSFSILCIVGFSIPYQCWPVPVPKICAIHSSEMKITTEVIVACQVFLKKIILQAMQEMTSPCHSKNICNLSPVQQCTKSNCQTCAQLQFITTNLGSDTPIFQPLSIAQFNILLISQEYLLFHP